MEKKTLLKIQRKFLALPLHHTDTSIIIEPEKTEDGRACYKYRNLIGYKYRCAISFPVLSELLSIILSLENYSERYELIEGIWQLIKTKKIELYPQKDIDEVLRKIKEIDRRIDSLDREILACAIENKATTLVTLDRNLINNLVLEKEFNIKIRHPKDLL